MIVTLVTDIFKKPLTFVLFVLLFLSHPSFTQENILDKTFSLTITNQPLEDALKSIEGVTDITFSYNSDIFPVDSVVSINFSNTSLQKALTSLLGEGTQYRPIGSTIILRGYSRKTKKTKTPIKGAITDANTGKKINDVTVFQVDKGRSTLSQNDGSYQLETKQKEEYIELSYNKKNYKDTIVFVKASEIELTNISLKPLDSLAFDSSLHDTIKVNKVEDVKLVQAIIKEEHVKEIENINNYTLKNIGQISIFPGLGTNRKMNAISENHFSFNLFAGYSGSVKGFEIGSLVNTVRNDVSGLQVSGLTNIVGGEVKGIQVAGLVNNARNHVQGLQLSGLTNICLDSVKGVQTSGLFNLSKGKIQGLQLSGIGNISTGELQGVQTSGFFNIANGKSSGASIAGFVNIANGESKGAQISGFLNYAKGTSDGVQITGFTNLNKGNVRGLQLSGFTNLSYNLNGSQICGGINYAKDVTGIQISLLNLAKNVTGSQIGLVNLADTLKGTQIGLINISKETKGTPIGLFTWVKKGYKKLEMTNSDVYLANLSFKTGTNRFYNIFSMGTIARQGYGFWTAGYGLGTRFTFKESKFSMDIETNFNAVIDEVNEDWKPNIYSNLNLSLAYDISPRFTIKTGPTFNVHTHQGSLPLSYIDVTSSTSQGDYLVDMWFGYQIGLRFW